MMQSFLDLLRAGILAGAICSTGSLAQDSDTTAPELFFVNPATGTEEVELRTPVTFAFSEQMAATQSIEWSANLNPANFNYTWMGEGQILIATYLADFPPNATITWKLNPTAGNASNFRDLAGNELPAMEGSFTTVAGGDPNDPCGQQTDDGRGAGSIFKSVQFVQIGNTAPVPDVEAAANFGASYRPGTNQSITSVTLSGPAGTFRLESFFGTFFASSNYNSGAALESAVPSGNYTMTLSGNGGGSVTLPIGSTAQLPIPRVSNLAELQNMDVTQPFTLNFSGFTGAGSTDGIFIEISSEEGEEEFHAPDPCIPRDLPNSATSVVIPANTFKASGKYRGSLSFTRLSFNTNSIANTSVTAGTSARTSFEFTIGGVTPPRQPMWSGIVRNVDGTLTFTIQGDTGLNIAIEGSDNVNTGWTQLSTAVLTTGSHQVMINPRLASKRFLRARVL